MMMMNLGDQSLETFGKITKLTFNVIAAPTIAQKVLKSFPIGLQF